MEELRKDVECTSQVIPHAAMVAAAAAGSAAAAAGAAAGRPNQMVAAVQAALAQQRSFAAAAAMAHGGPGLSSWSTETKIKKSLTEHHLSKAAYVARKQKCTRLAF